MIGQSLVCNAQVLGGCQNRPIQTTRYNRLANRAFFLPVLTVTELALDYSQESSTLLSWPFHQLPELDVPQTGVKFTNHER
jgi:hypothetical protein